MKFGINKNVNYYGSSERSERRVNGVPPKKMHQDSAITSHLDSLDSKRSERRERTEGTERREQSEHTESQSSPVTPSPAQPSSDKVVPDLQGVPLGVLVGSLIGGILLSKYLL